MTSTTQQKADEDVVRTHDDESNTTVWAWQVIANDANLTWVNMTATELAPGAVLRVTNVAMLYSHELLGNTYDLQKSARGGILLCRFV